MKKLYSLILTLLVLTFTSTASATEVWRLVTSESELAAGDQLIIGATVNGSSFAMSNESNTNFRKKMDATVAADELTYVDGMLILELGGTSGAWTFKTVNYAGTQGYIGNNVSKNYCKINATATTGYSAKITFSNNIPTIEFNNSNNQKYLYYNSTGGQERFACYPSTSKQKDISIYKKYDEDIAATAATPTFSNTGLVEVGTEISIACTTEGAEIHYTLDDSEPTASSTLYTEPIKITEAVTIKAIAVKEGLENSKVATAQILVPVKVENIDALLKANASLASNKTSVDTYELTGPVTAIYQNGSNLYVKDETGYLLIFGSLGKTYSNGDVIAAGIRGNVQNYYNLFELVSPVASTFQAGTAGTPVEPTSIKPSDLSSQPISSYVKLEGVTVAGMTASASNFDITDPAENKTVTGRNNYKIDAVNGENLTVYGFVVKYKENYQIYPIEITSADGKEVVAAPAFSVAGGTVSVGTKISLTTATEGASIYYTINGDEPTASSTLYTEPIVVNKDITIKAIAVKEGMENSSVVSAQYTVARNLAMFDFEHPATLNPAYPADINGEGLEAENANKQAIVSKVHFYNGNVAVTNTKGGSTDAKIYYQSGGDIQLRVYNGGSTTIQSTDPDNNIVKIVFTYNNGQTSYNKVTKPQVGEWTASTGTWTGDAQSITFAYTGTQQINSIEVTCAKDLTEGTPITNPKVGDVTETIALDTNTDVTVDYDLTVGFVNGSNIFACDADGKFIQIYVKNTCKVGDVIPAGWDATYSLYSNNTPQLIPYKTLPETTEGTFAATEVSGAEAIAQPVNSVFTIKDVVFDENTPSTAIAFTGTASETELAFFNNYKLAAAEAGKYDVTVVTVIKSGKATLYPTSYKAAASGIDSIEADDTDAPVEYFNLQGIRVDNPQNGMFIKRQGNKTTKVIL